MATEEVAGSITTFLPRKTGPTRFLNSRGDETLKVSMAGWIGRALCGGPHLCRCNSIDVDLRAEKYTGS
jgi:hypothetical protein